MPLKKICSVLTLIVLLAACATSPRPTVQPLSGDAYRRFLETMERMNQGKTSMTAFARIELASSDSRIPMKAAVMVKKPYHLRIEGIPVIGVPNFFLSLDGERLKVYLPALRRFYIAKATSAQMARFVSLNQTPESLVAILLGSYPEISGPISMLQAFQDDGLYRIDRMTGGKKSQSLWFDPVAGNLVRIDFFDSDRQCSSSIMFDRFTRIEQIGMPQKITIMTGESRQPTMTIHYSDIQFPVEMDVKDFDLAIPEGIQPIYLEDPAIKGLGG